MRSKRTRKFRDLLNALPLDVRRQAYAAYHQFKCDPQHSSLHFKQVKQDNPLYSVRIGFKYRALGIKEEDDLILWVWIGSQADYNQLISP